MALGPGKFDHLCTYVREQAKADAAIVIVVGRTPDKSGFSVQIADYAMSQLRLPSMLRTIADDIEVSLKAQA